MSSLWKQCPACSAQFALQASLNTHLAICEGATAKRRIAELEAACRGGLVALSKLRTAIDDKVGMAEFERLMIDTAVVQAQLEAVTR